MRVAMLTDTYDRIGGTEQAIRNAAVVLGEKGHDVKLIYSRKYYKIKSLLTALHKFDPDLIHAHTPGPLGNLGVLYGKAREIPVVGHFHSFPEVRLYFGKGVEQKALVELAWSFFKVFYRSCDAVVVPSKEVQKILFSKGFSNCALIPYGIDTNLFKRIRVNRGEMGLREDGLCLLYAGQFRKDKKVEVLIEAMQYLDDRFTLFLIGEGPRKKELLKLSSNGFSGEVVFHQPVDNRELIRYYCGADVYVNASISETLGFSMIEAMSCETPVVASASPGARELIDEGKNGFLAELDSPVSMAENILRISDGASIRRMGSFSRDFVVENYSIELMGERLDSLYCSFI